MEFLVIFEDDHLLVVNKPAGINTHAPNPYAGEGLYDWLRHREPRWAGLAIVQRLDKETSGVMVFPKTRLACQSLAEQFASRSVRKRYVLLTDRNTGRAEITAKSNLARAGEKYISRPLHTEATAAETRFRLLPAGENTPPESRRYGRLETRATSTFPGVSSESVHRGGLTWLEAEPLTGRTHQIRVHAAEHGFPILGDTLYGGTPAPRICLHAAELTLQHPATGAETTFCAPVDFSADARQLLRAMMVDSEATNAWRVIHGASDGWAGWQVDRLGDYLLSQSAHALDPAQIRELARLADRLAARGAYHKLLSRKVRGIAPAESSAQLVTGQRAPDRFLIRENGVKFEVSLQEGYSVGLFLDQRDNRRRLLTGHIGSDFSIQPAAQVLNAFAYTCGFSVCAAKAGARTTSLDLSKKYLEWGKRNFTLNQLDPGSHQFTYGDVFDWFRRLAKKRVMFDVILLDPPTFSQSRESGVFQVERDYGKLVSAALPLLKPNGVLFASTNAADWPPEDFLAVVERSIRDAKRGMLQRHYVPQPPDFPISRVEPAYLKTVWLRLA